MPDLKRQRGLSSIGWLFAISVFGFAVLVASKLGPHYLDNRFVVSTLENLAEDPTFPQMSRGEVNSTLKKTFKINNIRGKPVESVKISKGSEGTLVSIAYEERIPLMHNIDVVLKFHSELDSSQPDKCCKPSKKTKK